VSPRDARVWAPAAAVLVAALVWWRARDNAWTLVNPFPQGSRIIAFGDSLTAGVQVPEDQAYPAHLGRLLGTPVLAKGVPGDTTAEALARVDADVLAQDPRVVLVCLGGNDMLRGLPPEDLFSNLREIVRRIQGKGALVVIIGLDWRLPSRVDYGDRYRALARETGSVYVDDFLDGVFGDPRLMTDQIHPNAAGYERVARRIEAAAGKYLRR
jgi:lysophospholipase L1-like esterase